MKKIKYLFVSDTLSSGGAQRVASILTSGIAENGHEVHLILYERVDNEYPISSKVNIHILPKNKGNNKIKYYYNKFKLMRKIIKEIRPDIIIPFLPDQINHFFLASRFTGIPFISSVRNNPFVYPNSYTKRLIGKYIGMMSSGIFLQNSEQGEFYPKCIRHKTFIVPNPINNNLINLNYEYRDNIINIVTFGRLSPQKNHKLLIEAFSIVCRIYPNIRLNLYGQGEEEDRLKELVQNLHVGDKVIFKGRTCEVGKELLQNDLFVLSSDYEGMPNALMEAMAVGLPCISTDCPTGPKDLIKHNENGLLVKTGDVNELANAIKLCIENQELAHKMGKEAKKMISQEYKIDIIIERFIEETKKFVIRGI